jgi:hypothetical protein
VQFLLGKQREPNDLGHIGKVIGSIPTWISTEVDVILHVLKSGIYTTDFSTGD